MLVMMVSLIVSSQPTPTPNKQFHSQCHHHRHDIIIREEDLSSQDVVGKEQRNLLMLLQYGFYYIQTEADSISRDTMSGNTIFGNAISIAVYIVRQTYLVQRRASKVNQNGNEQHFLFKLTLILCIIIWYTHLDHLTSPTCDASYQHQTISWKLNHEI